jgi:hypothetical protein
MAGAKKNMAVFAGRHRVLVVHHPSRMAQTSSKIAMHDLDQLRRRLGIERLRILGRIDQMSADVILDHLHQQAVDRATATGNLMHDLRAACLAIERALNGFDLAANAAYPVQKLLLVANDVAHVRLFSVGLTLV